MLSDPSTKLEEERFFYHSFPRKRSADGLRILESICRNGLLLTLEIVNWPDPRRSSNENNSVYQRRVCFTEMAASDLKNHCDAFGSFCIEFPIKQLRRLGAMPVIYLPNFDPERSRGVESLATYMIANIFALKGILDALIDLQSTQPAPNNIFQVKQGDKVISAKIRPVEEQQILHRYVNEIMETSGRNFNELAASIETMASFWYPTDYRDNVLSNYRQREWRITLWSLYSFGKVFGPNKEQVEELINIDKDFFGQPAKDHHGKELLAEESCFLKEVGNPQVHVLTLATRLLVPTDMVVPAREILARFNIRVDVEAHAF